MKSEIVFGDEKLKKQFEEVMDLSLKKQLEKALDNLSMNAFCGI